jgi:oligosaccharide repeat unit polymerase
MSYLLAYITIIVLIVTLILIWKTYNLKALLHPGFYFCILWISCVSSFTILTLSIEQTNLYAPNHVNELNGFILFTSLCFLFLSRMGREAIKKNCSIWHVLDFQLIFGYFVIASFLSAIAFFIIRQPSLDFATTRELNVEIETAFFYGEESQTLPLTIIGIFLSTNIILGIYAGFIIGESYRKNLKPKICKYLLIVPIFTQIVIMLTVGGRVDFIGIMRAYVFGLGISFSNGISRRVLKKFMIYGIIIIFIFSAYSNFNYEKRVGNYKDQNKLYSKNAILRQFSSIIEYFNSVYIGYQLRRDDFVTEKLEYGEKTFAGILFLRIPFASTLGLKKASIGEIAGLDEYSMKKMFLDLQSKNALYFSNVSSIYLLFYDDFGFIGTFILILFLIWLTQKVYIRWFISPNRSFFSIFFLFIFFLLWSDSIMDPVFASGKFRGILWSVLFVQISLDINKYIFEKKAIKMKKQDNGRLFKADSNNVPSGILMGKKVQ